MMAFFSVPVIARCRESVNAVFAGTRKAVEDVIVSMVPQAVSVVTGFATSILVARGLGPKGMGNYALILSVSGLAAALSDLGIGQTAIRFASRAAENKDSEGQLAVLRWAFRLRMLLVLTTSFAAFAFAPTIAERFWHDAGLAPMVRISLLTGVFTAISAIPTIYFQSLKRFRMNAMVAVGQTLAAFIGIVAIALLKDWSIEKVITVSVVAAGLGAAAFIFLVPKSSFIDFREYRLPLPKLPKALLHAPHLEAGAVPAMDTTGANRFAFFMVLSSVLVTVTMRADVWLMGGYLDKAQIGLYSVATRFTLPLVIVLGALNTALWPRASALTSFDKTLEMIRKTFKMSLAVAFGAAVYSFVAPLATPFLFGATYGKGVFLAQMLCIRYCLSLLICPIGVIGYSLGLVRLYWLINLLQFAAVVAANVILLPRYGAIGAALALIVNELVGSALSVVVIRRKVLEMKRRRHDLV